MPVSRLQSLHNFLFCLRAASLELFSSSIVFTNFFWWASRMPRLGSSSNSTHNFSPIGNRYRLWDSSLSLVPVVFTMPSVYRLAEECCCWCSGSNRGVISVFTGKPILNKSSPPVCTHVAEGHSKAVLSLAVTDDVLFSSSKGIVHCQCMWLPTGTLLCMPCVPSLTVQQGLVGWILHHANTRLHILARLPNEINLITR